MLMLLKNGRFWLGLLVVNAIFLELQPVVLTASCAVVAFLFVTGTLLQATHAFRHSQGGQRFIALGFLWLFTGGLLSSYLGKKGWVPPDDDVESYLKRAVLRGTIVRLRRGEYTLPPTTD